MSLVERRITNSKRRTGYTKQERKERQSSQHPGLGSSSRYILRSSVDKNRAQLPSLSMAVQERVSRPISRLFLGGRMGGNEVEQAAFRIVPPRSPWCHCHGFLPTPRHHPWPAGAKQQFGIYYPIPFSHWTDRHTRTQIGRARVAGTLAKTQSPCTRDLGTDDGLW